MENVPEDKLKTKIVEMMPLKNIKSPYIIKKVFSSLNENRTFEKPEFKAIKLKEFLCLFIFIVIVQKVN